MRDITLADTINIGFSTRSFSTGAPTTLAGTPVISAYEDAGLTQITAGITLGVDHDSVTGFHMITVVATGANGFENDKDYNLVITTGTVGGVSVVGEVVGQFSIQRSPVNWANVSNQATAVDLSQTDIQLVDTTTTNTDMVAAAPTAAAVVNEWETQSQADPTGFHVNVLEVGGTAQTAGDIAALVNTVDTVVDGIQTDLSNGTDGLGALKALIDTVDTVVDAIKVVTDKFAFTVANQVNANGLSVGGTTQTAGDLAALITTLDTVADAIKAKTDSLTFTQAGHVDSNVQKINDVTITGDGSATPFDV